MTWLIIRLQFFNAGIPWGKGFRFFGRPIIQKHRSSIIRFGKDLKLRSSLKSNPLAPTHPVYITTWNADAKIFIGNDFAMSGGVICAFKEIIIGDHVMVGPDEEQLTPYLPSQAERLGCADRLRFAGLLKGDEVLLALADANLLLMPSEPESENFGMSAVEAMAAGFAILVSEGVPVGLWAEEAGAGRMVPYSPEAFSQATVEMISVPDALKEMGKRGQEFAQQRLDIASVAQQMQAQYKSIVETGWPLSTSQQITKE